MANIIIKDRKGRFGKTRSEQEEILRKEGWGGGMTGEEVEKAKFIEKQLKEEYGIKNSHIKQAHIKRMDEFYEKKK